MAVTTKVNYFLNRQLNFPTMNLQTAKTHKSIGNSNNYGQLKSIATTIRDRRSSPTKYDNRKTAYLLIVGSLVINIQYGRQYQTIIDDQIIIDNQNYIPQKQRPQNSRIIKVDRVEGLHIPGNNAVVDAVYVSQLCLGTGAFGQYKAAPSDN